MAWAGTGASLAALYASAASQRLGESGLMAVERNPLHAMHAELTLRTVSQTIAAAAYAMVGAGQDARSGKLDLVE